MSSTITSGRVKVQVGWARPRQPSRVAALVCVVGICPPGHPWLTDLIPHTKVRETRFRTGDGAVEHLRFTPGGPLEALPGLEGRYPSRVRDAARLILAAGAPEVDVLLARAGPALPWQLDRRGVPGLIQPFLDDLPGCLLVYPDAGGPVTVGPRAPHPSEQRLRRLVNTVRAHSSAWSARYQVGMVDLLEPDPALAVDAMRRMVGRDVVACRWSGSAHAMRRHGWRCAAAALAGSLLAGEEALLTRGAVGRSVPLGPGRRVIRDRRLALGEPPPQPTPPALAENCAVLQLHDRHDAAVIHSEPTLRRPVGDWSVPAMRTAKAVHNRIVMAAQPYVFERLERSQAFALVAAIAESLQPFVSAGVLVGPEGEGPPEVTGGVTTPPAMAPGLHAEINAQLRPWCQRVSLSVALRGGGQPTLEVRA